MGPVIVSSADEEEDATGTERSESSTAPKVISIRGTARVLVPLSESKPSSGTGFGGTADSL